MPWAARIANILPISSSVTTMRTGEGHGVGAAVICYAPASSLMEVSWRPSYDWQDDPPLPRGRHTHRHPDRRDHELDRQGHRGTPLRARRAGQARRGQAY